jgi:hypothetical protein
VEDKTNMDKDALLKEYDIGTTICRHYVTLRRDVLVFFTTVQGAIISVLFGLKTPSLTLQIGLSVIAVFVALLTINNDIRTIDHYFGFIERLEEIEKELGMKMYSVHKRKVQKETKALSNIVFFRGLPVVAIVFWIAYIVVAIAM